MRLFFGLIAAALLFASLSGASQSYDGSVLLYRTLEDRTAFVPNQNLIHAPLELLPLLLSSLTTNVNVIRRFLGIIYASIPLIVLALAWWVIREAAPGLFVWAALGILLAILPGQFSLTNEALLVFQLSWPIYLTILSGIRRVHAPMLIILSTLILIGHPSAILLLVIATGLVLLSQVTHPRSSDVHWRWGVWFGALTIFSLIKTA